MTRAHARHLTAALTALAFTPGAARTLVEYSYEGTMRDITNFDIVEPSAGALELGTSRG